MGASSFGSFDGFSALFFGIAENSRMQQGWHFE
jgi:hypothetical protein